MHPNLSLYDTGIMSAHIAARELHLNHYNNDKMHQYVNNNYPEIYYLMDEYESNLIDVYGMLSEAI